MLIDREKTVYALSAVQALMAINMSGDDSEFTKIYLKINQLISEVSNRSFTDRHVICQLHREGFDQCLKSIEVINEAA